MQTDENESSLEQGTENEKSETKQSVRSKKSVYSAIKRQIEFYFSDVNLMKDRFFANKLKESPYIEMEYILNCNRIRQLEANPSDIIKALKYSKLVSVTSDGTKLFRTKPVQPIENEDECTIYVEDLPLDTNHEWLRKVFSVFGSVVYVSVPKYQESKKIKGFAFIQFETPQGALNALTSFERVNSCLSSNMPSVWLKSIKSYEGDKDDVLRKSPIRNEEVKYVSLQSDQSSDADNKNYKSEDQVDSKVNQENIKKSEHADSSSAANEQQKVKRKHKMSTTETEHVEKTIENDELTTVTGEQNTLTADHKKKRNRKHKRKRFIDTHGMHILSKKDWKKLRNKYLEAQKKRARELKHQLQQIKHSRFESSDDQKEENKEITDSEQMNSSSEMSTARVHFTPGVIVKISLNYSINKLQTFKDEVRSMNNVEYVDIENRDTVFVRCSSSDAANGFVASDKWPVMEILEGEEEQTYWKKVFEDRKTKMKNKIRKKYRGKDKLKKKAEALSF